MTIFPFIAKHVFQGTGVVNTKAIDALVKERKKLIPKWVMAMLEAG
jgi:hypothetical protein